MNAMKSGKFAVPDMSLLIMSPRVPLALIVAAGVALAKAGEDKSIAVKIRPVLIIFLLI